MPQSHAFIAAALLTGSLAACGEPPNAPSIIGPTAMPPPPPAGPTVDVTGTYTMTLTASPRCMQAHDEVSRRSLPFPTAVQSRTYDATITQSGARLEIQFTPAECQGGYYGKPGLCAPLPDSFDCHVEYSRPAAALRVQSAGAR
jgi:hypothetical protein